MKKMHALHILHPHIPQYSIQCCFVCVLCARACAPAQGDLRMPSAPEGGLERSMHRFEEYCVDSQDDVTLESDEGRKSMNTGWRDSEKGSERQSKRSVGRDTLCEEFTREWENGVERKRDLQEQEASEEVRERECERARERERQREFEMVRGKYRELERQRELLRERDLMEASWCVAKDLMMDRERAAEEETEALEASWRSTHELVRQEEQEARERDRKADRLIDEQIESERERERVDGLNRSLGWAVSRDGSKVNGFRAGFI